MQTNATEVVRAHDLTHDVREVDFRLILPATWTSSRAIHFF